MHGRVLAALLLLALLPTAAAAAEGQGAVRLSVVAYHPYPDTLSPADGGDPFGFPLEGGRDPMATRYGAYYFPTVRFDGVVEEANRADSAAATYVDAYRRHVLDRLARESPIVLRVNGTLDDRNGTVHVRATAFANLSAERLVLRAALVEDDVRYPGTNGVDLHRFVARAQLPDRVIAWENVGDRAVFEVAHGFRIGNGADGLPWRQGHLGVVAWVQSESETGRFRPQEVVQSATHLFRSPAPTVQVGKAPLLELYTATWCEACVFGDGAVDVLLAEFGIPTTVAPAHAWAYLRPPGIPAAVAIAVLGGAAAWAVTRRWP